MALDGIFLRHVKQELEKEYIGAKIEKVYQPSKEEIVLALRSRTAGGKLLLSARANSPRIHITKHSPENPLFPPMFCMLLRKRLTGARLASFEQVDVERMLRLRFDTVSELGDPTTLCLIIEIMGRHSNVILTDGEGVIVDALKRVYPEMSSQRMVLPGLALEAPPAQDKLSVLSCTPDEIVSRVRTMDSAVLSKALLSAIQGISPIVARELEHRACKGEVRVCQMNEGQWERLSFHVGELIATARSGRGTPCMVTGQDGNPLDFSFMEIRQYGAGAQVSACESFSALLDAYYAKRDSRERMRVRSHDLLKLLSGISDRLSRKINAQLIDLKKCAERDTMRLYGDLISANAYRLQKGDAVAAVENFYEDPPIAVSIPLDVMLTPAANAQKYYKDYRKQKTAEQMLTVQVAQAEKELEYIDSVFDLLSRAESERELTEIRQELMEQGYLRRAAKGKTSSSAPLPPRAFLTKGGFEVLVGRNNRQNDQLTLGRASAGDLWFHVKNIPGSHTVLVTQGKEVPEEDILEVAALAALHSKAAASSQVPVDFTEVRYVKKPAGAKPGMVIYDKYKTVFVTPQRDGTD